MRHEIETRHNAGDILLGIAFGAAAGAALALLLAPASGVETRRRIGAFAHDLGERSKRGADSATRAFKDQARRIEHAFEAGREAWARETATAKR